MVAFIVAGIIFAGTCLASVLIVFADGMSDAPSTSIDPAPVFVTGTVIAALIAASHWFPHIGW
jgi:hypothetical protein